MSEATFTFRVDESLKEQFSTAAKSRDRTGAQLLRDFMRDFVKQQQEATEHDAWFRRQVQIGLDSANAGKLIPAEEVEAAFAAKRAATLGRLKASGTGRRFFGPPRPNKTATTFMTTSKPTIRPPHSRSMNFLRRMLRAYLSIPDSVESVG